MALQFDPKSRSSLSRTRAVWIALGVVLASGVATASEATDAPIQPHVTETPSFLKYDPRKVIADETAKCGMCHVQESQVWMKSSHHMTFEERHWTRKAQAINKRLGQRSIRRNAECALCHYTETSNYISGETRAVLGVSCQRCHGPAMDWWGTHDKGSPNSTFADRAPELERKGMRHSHSLYELYSSCYQCHTVPRENLVNEGRHQPGTLSFELVAWSEGEVRHHNFKLHNRKGNEPATLEHRRFLYVLGKILDLEYGLRALAYASESGRYDRAQRLRIQLSANSLREPQLQIPEVTAVQAIADSLLFGENYADLPIEGREEYVNCALKIGDFAHQFEEKRHTYTEELAKVDPFLPKTVKGDVFQGD